MSGYDDVSLEEPPEVCNGVAGYGCRKMIGKSCTSADVVDGGRGASSGMTDGKDGEAVAKQTATSAPSAIPFTSSPCLASDTSQ